MKLRITAGLAGLSACLGLAIAHAQTATPAASATAVRPVVLRAAHLFDGRSGQLVSPGVVVVQGQKIVAAGSSANVPEGARVIELGDATLLPGFIDAHVHIADDYDADWEHGALNSLLRPAAEQAFHAAHNAKLTLEAGFTTVRNVGAADFVDVALRNAIDEGLAEGPRMIVAGHTIGSTGGHCDSLPIPPERMREAAEVEGVCNGPESCRRAVREQMKFGADVIKICASGGVLSPTDPVDVPQFTAEELRAIIGEAHTWGRKVAAHSHGDLAAKMAVEAGVDSIEHGSFLQPPTLQLMKQKGVYLVPTRMTQVWVLDKADTYPPKIAAKARAAGAAHATMFRNALKIGVPIALGTDAAVFPHALNAQEFGDYVDLGMAPAAALLASSQGAAKLLGVDGETGTLEAGKAADVVAVPGNVLENIRATEHPSFVMKQGAVVVGAAD